MSQNQTIDGVPRKSLEQALKLAAVFDDGGDGADAESARGVVWILRALLDAPAVSLADEGEMPAAQPQGDTVPVSAHWSDWSMLTLEIDGRHRTYVECGKPERLQPPPVAPTHPFAEKVIRKLERFQECADDSQGADIGRHWFDLLTQLGLLNRVQRSPALWEMTQQGEDALELSWQSAKSR